MGRFVWTPSLLAALLAAAWSAPALAVTITVTSGGVRSYASDGPDGAPDQQTTIPLASPPASGGPAVATSGGSSATSSFTFTGSYLQIDFTHVRTASGGYAYSDDVAFGDTYFGVSAPILATISGAYTVADTGGGDRVIFVANLFDDLNNVTLHATSLESRVTPNESFVVGQSGGDFNDGVLGATTHLLQPGIAYNLNWIALVQDLRADAGDTGATASGYIRIDFVPEPSTALLFAAGLAGLAQARAARRRWSCAAAER
jgi:hypothetical protein